VAEQYLFAAANAERTQRGLQPLRWDPVLYVAADRHAHEMAARASISHQYPGEPDLAERGRAVGARFSLIAENVAEAPTAVRIQDAWMNSPGHRANLLDAQVDTVAIRVLSRDGQLYAVEDFSRTVVRLTLDQQEQRVAALLQATAPITVLPTTDAARKTCSMETGYAGAQRPLFVMRYSSSDLATLPDALKNRLDAGKARNAVVGACETNGAQNFTAFNIAVLLYP
jgi:hypothetical protein